MDFHTMTIVVNMLLCVVMSCRFIIIIANITDRADRAFTIAVTNYYRYEYW